MLVMFVAFIENESAYWEEDRLNKDEASREEKVFFRQDLLWWACW